MKRLLLYSIPLLMAVAANAKAPDNYYSSLEGKNKATLKAAAKAKVRSHTVVSYGDATWDAFAKTDVRIVDGRAIWWDMYSPEEVLIASGHPGMNIEHAVANSWWGGTKNDAYKDLFHLNPSDATANNWKSNYPLGYVQTVHVTNKGVKQDNGVTKVGKPASGDSGGAPWVYEPADAYKGDMARAFMYIFTVYDDIAWMADSSDRNYMFDGSTYPSFRQWAIDLLLEWSRLDPVDTKEVNRNEEIYKIQGNRNPFIDCPDLAEYIWGNKKDQGFVYDGDYEPGQPVIPDPIDPDDPDDPDTPDVPDTPDPVNPPSELLGKWVMVQPDEAISATAQYAIVSANAHAVFSTTKNSTYFQPTASMADVRDGVIEQMPAGAAVFNIIPNDGGYSLQMRDADGNPLGYLLSTSAKNLSLSDTPGTDTKADINITSQGTDIDFGAAGKICYNQNKNAERFTTYTSNSMERINLYVRVDEAGEPAVLPAPTIYVLDRNGEETTGKFVETAYVEISYPDDPEAFIYYTLDGVQPEVDPDTYNEGNVSTRFYCDIFEVSESCTLKAIAIVDGRVTPTAELTLTKEKSDSLEELADEDIIGFETPGVRIFDLTGTEVSADHLPSGIYILVRGTRAIKAVRTISTR